MGVAVAMAVCVAPAAAQAANPTFACRASALKAPLLGQPVVANNPYNPCKSESKSLTGRVEVPGLLVAYGLQAVTVDSGINPDGRPTLGGAAVASVAYAAVNVLNAVKIEAYALSSTAGRKCLSPLAPPDLGGFSAIAHLRINGRPLPVSIPLKIPLGIVTIYVNYGIKTGTEVLTRALWVDFAGDANDIILGEARGGGTNSLCPLPTTPGT
jgi:hypothetical protein